MVIRCEYVTYDVRLGTSPSTPRDVAGARTLADRCRQCQRCTTLYTLYSHATSASHPDPAHRPSVAAGVVVGRYPSTVSVNVDNARFLFFGNSNAAPYTRCRPTTKTINKIYHVPEQFTPQPSLAYSLSFTPYTQPRTVRVV